MNDDQNESIKLTNTSIPNNITEENIGDDDDVIRFEANI